MQLVYYSNDLNKTIDSLKNALQSDDSKIKSKYSYLLAEGYELKGISIYDSYMLDARRNPTHLTYDVYRFENEDEEQRELIVTQNLKLYKGSLAALERSAIYHESVLFNSDEFKEFKNFGKFLDSINRNAEAAYLYGTNYDLKGKLFHTNSSEIMNCLERITWDLKESNIRWLDPAIKRYKVEAYGIRNSFIIEARNQYNQVLSDINKLRELINDNKFPCQTVDGQITVNAAFIKVLNILDAAIYNHETNRYTNRTFDLILKEGNAKDISDVLAISLESKNGEVPYHKEFSEKMSEYIFKQLKENPEVLETPNFNQNLYDFVKFYKPSRDEAVSEMFFDGEVMLTLRSPKYKLNGLIRSEKEIIKELYKENSKLLMNFINANDKQEFIDSHSRDFLGIFDKDAGQLMKKYEMSLNTNDEIFRANILNNIYYNKKVSIPSYTDEQLSQMPNEFKEAFDTINTIANDQAIKDLHRKYQLDKEFEETDLNFSIEQIQEFITSKTMQTQVLEEHANGWKEIKFGGSYVESNGQMTSSTIAPDQDDENLEKEYLEDIGAEEEDDELEPTLWPRNSNFY